MEAMVVAQVGAWLRDELLLPQYAAAAAEHQTRRHNHLARNHS